MAQNQRLDAIDSRLVRIEDKLDKALELSIVTKEKSEGQAKQLMLIWTGLLTILGYIVKSVWF